MITIKLFLNIAFATWITYFRYFAKSMNIIVYHSLQFVKSILILPFNFSNIEVERSINSKFQLQRIKIRYRVADG